MWMIIAELYYITFTGSKITTQAASYVLTKEHMTQMLLTWDLLIKKFKPKHQTNKKKTSTLGTVQSGAKPFTQMSPKIFSHDAEHHVKWKHRISVKHDSLVVLGLFCSQVLIEPTANSSEYQNILESNVRPPVCQLKICLNWVTQQDDDYKAQQQIWNRTAEEEKNHGVAMAQSLIVGEP